jgi:hypothetical protein
LSVDVVPIGRTVPDLSKKEESDQPHGESKTEDRDEDDEDDDTEEEILTVEELVRRGGMGIPIGEVRFFSEGVISDRSLMDHRSGRSTCSSAVSSVAAR